MKTIENICYANRQDENLHLDIYLPKSESFDVFIYFHGGGLEAGSKEDAKDMASWLAERGIAVVACDYRKYPKAIYPDFVRDAGAAVHWVSNHIGEYGKCNRIFVGGSSAGAYLSMMLCFDSRWYRECGEYPIKVAGYFHDAGQPTVHFNVLRERGIDSRRVIIDDSAPLYHIGKEKSYPSMMFVVSDNDMENRFEQTQLILSTLRHFEYNESTISYCLMNGKHCAYFGAVDDNGDSVFGKMILEWINTCD